MKRLWFLIPVIAAVTLVAAPAAAKRHPHHPRPTPTPTATATATASPTPTPAPTTPTPAPQGPAAAPFTWQGQQWCPTYQAAYGCNTTQQPRQYTVSFAPAQVTQDGSGGIALAMNAAATASGAFNTQTHETWTPPATVTETVTVACDATGLVENWPAFWLDGTVGSWPAHGEIDIAEGTKGAMGWHYHYLNASGVSAQVGGKPAGDWCGTHTYSATWTAAAITFTWDGTVVGTVTPAAIGVPIATDPMYVINDYGAGSAGGPTTAGAQMTVGSFTAAP